ncbi:MAG TPA: phenylalanine--tRNA ligase subunit beta [Candidatus Paceibacterota bacterium]
MLYSYSWIQEYIKGTLPKPDKLADLLNMHAFEVEEIRKRGKDTLLDIAVLPNRAHDCLSHVGMAREIAAIAKLKLIALKTKTLKAQKGRLASLKVQIQTPDVPRYTALVVEDVTIKKSPKWLADKLTALGLNSINNVVDLTNFIMLELGQPLHAFDYDQIKGNKMTIREARAGEKLETLDNKTLSLPKDVLIIEDAERLIDLAGIKGGKVSAISVSTQNIVLQAASFNAETLYRAKSQLNYTTQAADLYSHGLDPNLTSLALERAAALLSELGINGKITQLLDIYPKRIQPMRIILRMPFLESMLGIPIPQKEVKQVLENLGCKVIIKPRGLEVSVPTRRIDLTIEEDLVEEVGRMHGYERIPLAFPVASLIPPPRNNELLWQERIRDTFKGLGFKEAYNYSFVGEKDLSQFAYSKADQAKLIELENPISEDFSYLRDSLIEGLLKNARDNQKSEKVIRIFEIGKVFRQKFQETNVLGALVHDGNFYEIKGICDFLLNSLGITEVWYDEYQQTPEKGRPVLWNQEKSAELKVGSQEIGFLGEISSAVCANLKIAKPVVALQLDIKKLIMLGTEERSYEKPSKFPSATRDIAVVVPLATKVAEVMNIMENAGGQLVVDIDIFDIYEGEQIAKEKKNLAFHIIYQADNRTLTNKEVDSLHEKIVKAVQENPEWEVRT